MLRSGIQYGLILFHSLSLSPAPPSKRHKMSVSTASPVMVAIELGYQDLMNDSVSYFLDKGGLIHIETQYCGCCDDSGYTVLYMLLCSIGYQEPD